jgi:hypothetical protein
MMAMAFALLRRSRLITGLLFAASPAIGGTVLPAVHPCPVDAPWLARHAAGAHAGHHGGHDAPADTHHNDTCHCIGSWLSGAAVAPPHSPATVRQILTLFSPPAIRTRDSSLQLDPPAALLPPATAPPLV